MCQRSAEGLGSRERLTVALQKIAGGKKSCARRRAEARPKKKIAANLSGKGKEA